jgi:spore coat protein JB
VTERECLLKELTEQKFAAYEVTLFLDTHPSDLRALEAHDKYVCRYNELKQQYEERYGILSIMSQNQGNEWTWNRNPWPWD